MRGMAHRSSAKEELELVPPSKLSIENVSKNLGGTSGHILALDRVSLNVAEGEFVRLVGASGCGKTTLLNITAGLEKPDDGRLLADGKRVTGPGRERLVMFQEPALFPWLSVLGNVLVGLKFKPNLSRRERHEVARYYLALVGMSRFQHANIHELSGGVKQRVALARALAPNRLAWRMALRGAPRTAFSKDGWAYWQCFWASATVPGPERCSPRRNCAVSCPHWCVIVRWQTKPRCPRGLQRNRN
ncbi:hypothetical protein MPNT_210027 [Candidatus Methylacidithermus pantelleriae]|uniref:ABC transporter domain-containing protein n=1 Tax=Candidatus Methylacidithermus pantelleriae TaxID=2744239 RepID=A0A8J2BIB7_9BACT|nr:hypothetical protein MPNT_210027 [Candidatus Methylacidithermus pantelleriae]